MFAAAGDAGQLVPGDTLGIHLDDVCETQEKPRGLGRGAISSSHMPTEALADRKVRGSGPSGSALLTLNGSSSPRSRAAIQAGGTTAFGMRDAVPVTSPHIVEVQKRSRG